MKTRTSLMLLFVLSVVSFGCAHPKVVTQEMAPNGAIHKTQKVWRLSPPEGFGAALAWAQAVANDVFTDKPAVAYIEYMKLVKVKNGVETIIAEDRYFGTGPLSADRGGLYVREPNWFANDSHTPMTNSHIMDNKLVIDVAETRDKVPHWWTIRVPIEKDAEYKIEVSFMIIGDASIQFGVDYWRDLYVGHNGWDQKCIGKNNCEAFVSPWFGSTGNKYAKVKVPL